jgi:hypothetical protein
LTVPPKAENKKVLQQHKHMEDKVDRRLCSSNSNNQKPNHSDKNPRRRITWLTGSLASKRRL